MRLSELSIKEEYFTGEVDLIDAFYRPCLSLSNRYDRSVGFFRSSIFLLVGPDLIAFAKQGGKVRLISSPCLTEDDISAITEGYSLKEEAATAALERDIEELIKSKPTIKNTEALATLISLGVIDVKLVFFPEAEGEYHTKLGIFRDPFNNSVVFKGSVNETWRGWHERGNHETLDVFCSWHQGRESQRVERNQAYFEDLWHGRVKDLEVIEFPDVAYERLKSIAKGSLDDIDIDLLTDYFMVGNQTIEDNTSSELNDRDKRAPLKHQLKAIANWKKQDKRGIFEHATGSGKTFTALCSGIVKLAT